VRRALIALALRDSLRSSRHDFTPRLESLGHVSSVGALLARQKGVPGGAPADRQVHRRGH
jgi:hypothetical protein